MGDYIYEKKGEEKILDSFLENMYEGVGRRHPPCGGTEEGSRRGDNKVWSFLTLGKKRGKAS